MAVEIALPTKNNLFKVNNRNFWKRCEICSKLTVKTPERRQWRCSVGFIVNFDHIWHLLVFSLLTLNTYMSAGTKLHTPLFWRFLFHLVSKNVYFWSRYTVFYAYSYHLIMPIHTINGNVVFTLVGSKEEFL